MRVVLAWFVNEIGEDVCLQVVHFDERNVESLCKTLGEGRADKEGTHQARSARERHGIELIGGDVRLLECHHHGWHDVLLVSAGCQFRHHAAVEFVHFLGSGDLAEEQSALEYGSGCVVAGRFNGENVHNQWSRKDILRLFCEP